MCKLKCTVHCRKCASFMTHWNKTLGLLILFISCLSTLNQSWKFAVIECQHTVCWVSAYCLDPKCLYKFFLSILKCRSVTVHTTKQYFRLVEDTIRCICELIYDSWYTGHVETKLHILCVMMACNVPVYFFFKATTAYLAQWGLT